MTRNTNARLAGLAYLFYIAIGMSSMAVPEGTHVTSLLTVLMSLSALTLGVTLYAITREQDADLALLAMGCRFVEAIPTDNKVGYLFFAVASTIFSWLLLRGRFVPAPLAWLGVLSSGLLVVTLPPQLALTGKVDFAHTVTWVVSIPALAFELALAGWFLARGVAAPARMPAGDQVSAVPAR